MYSARLEDESSVCSLLENAKAYCATKDGNEPSTKEERLQELVTRIEKMGSTRWTEYRILPLAKKLAKFYEDSELLAKSMEKLTELNEYARILIHDTTWNNITNGKPT